MPVYTSNEDYTEKGTASPEEKAAWRRIYLETLNAKLSAGSVHVYILRPDGRVYTSLHVAKAAEKQNLLTALEETIQTLQTPEGKPLARPVSQMPAPKVAPGSLLLHLTARYLLPPGSWNELPGENWIVLEREQVAKLLPTGPVKVGTSWEWEEDPSKRILNYCYPQTENNDISTNRIESYKLRATAVSIRKGIVHAQLEGNLTMKHPFYPNRADDQKVQTPLKGILDFETETGKIRSLRLITDNALYGKLPFGVVLRSMP